ncbi:MAG: porin [Fidelibacterota bacterium]
MNRFYYWIIAVNLAVVNGAAGKEEPLVQQIRSAVQHEAFTVNALVQSGFRYSLGDDNFQGGRTFEAANARLSFRGNLDGGFFYRLFFNLVKEPNLLDAYIGYRFSDALRITTGAMKPKQTLDFIPDPGSMDFIDRTHITDLLVQSREIGVSFEGDVGGLYYFSGIFNGNKLSSNNNNEFYGIGRLQYTLGDLQLAVQGSHGNSPGVQTGNAGPVLQGKRTIYGGDVRLKAERLLLAAEYLAGSLDLDSTAGSDKKDLISGYYITAGYRILEKTMLLSRWQSWGYREQDFRDHQVTFGINHNFTGVTRLQLNADAYFPEKSDRQYGLSLLLQVQF